MSDYPEYPEEPVIDTLADADEGTERRLKAFPNPAIEESPVAPLGFTGGRVVFAMPEGEIRIEPAAKIAGMLRTDIFACQAGQAFLGYWRDGDDKFQRDLATVWFVRKCREAGIWDTNRTIRSLGVWPGGPMSIVLHLGDEVRIHTPGKAPETMTIIQALRSRTGPLYRLRPPAPRPKDAASSADGRWVRAQFDLWRFEPIGAEGLSGADVAAGWAGAAMLGAAAPFRGHLLVSALAGSGKSTLIAFVHALMSAIAGDVIDSFTEAGLRNDLAGMARPVLIDEAEASSGVGGPGVVERALELLRRMSTGSGGTRKMGDIGGGSVTQTAVGAVMLAAINPPKLGPADGTRMVEVRMLPLNAPEREGEAPRAAVAADATLAAVLERAGELAPALLGRALAGVWRYRADIAELKAAFGRAQESPRTADLVSMLAAGRRLLMFDDPLTPEEADEEVRFWRPLLAQREAAEVVSNPGADALGHLMAADAGVHRSDRRQTIGELIQRWAANERDYDEVLKAFGVRLFEGDGPGERSGPWLIVANHHPALVRIFDRTPWADWRRTLTNLDALGPEHATWPTKALRYGVGVKQRGIAIPLTPWIEGSIRGRGGERSTGVPGGVPGQVDDW